METLQIIEYTAVAFNVLFLLFIMRESIWAWPCGIIGSSLGVYYMYQMQYYSESSLNIFYIIMGFYGWYVWTGNGSQGPVKIHVWKNTYHMLTIGVSICLALVLGYLMERYTDAKNAYPDAFTTVFSFAATFLEARKVLTGWIYWIVINGFTIWLYFDRGMEVYPYLAIFYTVLSVVGYFQWRKIYYSVSSD